MAIMACGAAGCDKLASLTGGKPKSGQSEASATPQEPAPPPRPAVPPAELIATVNGVAITKADVQQRIEELKTLSASLRREWTPLSPEQRGVLLTELINNELMSQDAVGRGLDRQRETQQRWDALRRGFFVQEWIRWNQKRSEPASEAIEQYYEQNKLGFRIPERRQLRELVVASEEPAKQALAKLLADQVDFAGLAQQISVGASAGNGGLLAGWVMRANAKAFVYGTEPAAQAAGVISLDPALEAAAFAIDQIGGLSNYVKGPDNQFHIFQLVQREEERQRPLTEVWDQIKNYLLLQKLQGAVDELRAKAKIEQFPERLEGGE